MTPAPVGRQSLLTANLIATRTAMLHLPSLRFDTIHIIESLTEGRTGFRLFEDLEQIGIHATPAVAVRFWRTITREEFLDRLREIAKDALENNHSPILHIDTRE
jgi:hypothetical protein